jgi:homoserine dehydrogenase
MFAALTEELAEAGVSIDKLIQESAGDTGAAPVAIMTHPCPRASVEKALAKIAALAITADEPRLLRIETRA